jgi:hypothetical protein
LQVFLQSHTRQTVKAGELAAAKAEKEAEKQARAESAAAVAALEARHEAALAQLADKLTK